MARVPVRSANLTRLVAGTAVLAYSLGALAVARGPGELTTYAGSSDLAAALAALAGLGLVAAGLVASLARPAERSGDLALLAGVFWFAPFWAGWKGGPPLVVTLGTVTAGFVFALLLHLVVAYPSGGLRSTGARALVVVVYVEAALFALGSALFRDPFFDPDCWNNCTDNVFLVQSDPGIARRIEDVDLWFTAAAATALGVLCAYRLAAASAPARRALWPMLAGGIGVAGATLAHALALQRTAIEDPGDRTFLSVFLVACAAVILVALGLVWAVLRAWVQRRSVARIVADLGEAPPAGSLESALARAVGDPQLRIAYWLPASRRYVDSGGQPLDEPAPTPGRAVTELVRDGRRVALLEHAAGIAELEREIGAAVRLALENERLQAEVLAQLHDLRASRLRIVETADGERRRLERDLHDGAQQRLLALSYDLRVARAEAEDDGDVGIASVYADATEDAQAALGELRELANGIYPAVLGEAGLAPALATLADEAPLPVELGDVATDREAPAVETTAYVTVAEAIDDAARRGATFLSASVRRDSEHLVVTIEDDGTRRNGGLLHLADRVGALGGALEVGDITLRAELPCG